MTVKTSFWAAFNLYMIASPRGADPRKSGELNQHYLNDIPQLLLGQGHWNPVDEVSTTYIWEWSGLRLSMKIRSTPFSFESLGCFLQDCQTRPLAMSTADSTAASLESCSNHARSKSQPRRVRGDTGVGRRPRARSQGARSIRAFLTARIVSRADVVIDKVIVIGLGSLSTRGCGRMSNGQAPWQVDGTAYLDPTHSITQLVALEDWLGALRAKFSISQVALFDPTFNRRDTMSLQARGFNAFTRRVPRGIVTPRTFLFAPFVDFSVLAQIPSVVKPAVLIAPCLTNGPQISGKRDFLSTTEAWDLSGSMPSRCKRILEPLYGLKLYHPK